MQLVLAATFVLWVLVVIVAFSARPVRPVNDEENYKEKEHHNES